MDEQASGQRGSAPDGPVVEGTGRIIDLFAGPGGWSEGLRMLGLTEFGIEWDESACATARAAGHERLLADVAALNPLRLPCTCEITAEEFECASTPWHRRGCPAEWANVWGLIGSPPCPTFSNAGKGAGRRDMEHVIACAMELATGNDTRAEHRAACEDERSMLVVEPLRWALALRPEWIALEQVPPVLELWSMFGHILAEHGYSVWVGVLEAERFGVPQTRERAILMASRVRAVVPPRPTHQRYVPGEPQQHGVVTLEGEVEPWVSMAEALGWGMTERPGLTFAPGTGNGGAAYEGGSGARAAIRRERDRGAWVVQTGNFTAKTRDADGGRSRAGSEKYERPVDAPAPVVTGNVDRWGLDRRQGGAPVRRMDEPAHTISSAGLFKGRDVWVHERRDAIRVTVPEAAALQSFRPDYPWQGNKSKQYQQIGNAVPPLLARAILAALVPSIAGRLDVTA